MNLDGMSMGNIRLCIPRVSGDEPFYINEYVDVIWYSPRERG